MNKTQKSAWYGILLSVLLAGIVVFDLIDTIVGWPTKLLVGLVWGGLLFIPIYFIDIKKHPHQVDMDERDKRIIKRAIFVSFVLLAGMLSVTFVAALFGLAIRGTLSVTMDELSAVIYFTFIAFILVLSLAVLFQYGRLAKGENNE